MYTNHLSEVRFFFNQVMMGIQRFNVNLVNLPQETNTHSIKLNSGQKLAQNIKKTLLSKISLRISKYPCICHFVIWANRLHLYWQAVAIVDKSSVSIASFSSVLQYTLYSTVEPEPVEAKLFLGSWSRYQQFQLRLQSSVLKPFPYTVNFQYRDYVLLLYSQAWDENRALSLFFYIVLFSVHCMSINQHILTYSNVHQDTVNAPFKKRIF